MAKVGVGDRVKVINGNLDGEKGIVTIIHGEEDCQIQVRDETYRVHNSDLKLIRKYRKTRNTDPLNRRKHERR